MHRSIGLLAKIASARTTSPSEEIRLAPFPASTQVPRPAGTSLPGCRTKKGRSSLSLLIAWWRAVKSRRPWSLSAITLRRHLSLLVGRTGRERAPKPYGSLVGVGDWQQLGSLLQITGGSSWVSLKSDQVGSGYRALLGSAVADLAPPRAALLKYRSAFWPQEQKTHCGTPNSAGAFFTTPLLSSLFHPSRRSDARAN